VKVGANSTALTKRWNETFAGIFILLVLEDAKDFLLCNSMDIHANYTNHHFAEPNASSKSHLFSGTTPHVW